MRRYSPALLAALALLLLFGDGSRARQDKTKDKKGAKAKPAAAYYPLTVGSTWEYRAGGKKVTVRVARQETVGQDTVAVLETTLDGKKLTEHVGLKKDGVYRYRGEGVEYRPPLCFLKLPPKDGETWTVKSRGAGLDIEAKFTAGEAEVTVPAGMYEAVTASAPDFRIDTVKTPTSYWFVPGIGMVKQRLVVGGREVVIELEKYTPAK